MVGVSLHILLTAYLEGGLFVFLKGASRHRRVRLYYDKGAFVSEFVYIQGGIVALRATHGQLCCPFVNKVGGGAQMLRGL